MRAGHLESIEQNKTCFESLMEFKPSPSLSLGYQKELSQDNKSIHWFSQGSRTDLPTHSELNKRIVHDYLTTKLLPHLASITKEQDSAAL